MKIQEFTEKLKVVLVDFEKESDDINSSTWSWRTVVSFDEWFRQLNAYCTDKGFDKEI